MAIWEAQVRVVQSAPFMTVQVEAGSAGVAQQTINQIYNPVQVINLRQLRQSSNSTFQSESSYEGGALIFGLIVLGGLFLYLTPYVLSVIYGGTATWISQKVVGQTLAEYGENNDNTQEDDKKASIVFCSALIFGLIGFIHGTVWHQDLKKQYIDNSTKSEIHKIVTFS